MPRLIITRKNCFKCHVGEMEPTGVTSFTSTEFSYQHKCDKCEHLNFYLEPYPKKETVYLPEEIEEVWE